MTCVGLVPYPKAIAVTVKIGHDVEERTEEEAKYQG